jgi:hypothetical protein
LERKGGKRWKWATKICSAHQAKWFDMKAQLSNYTRQFENEKVAPSVSILHSGVEQNITNLSKECTSLNEMKQEKRKIFTMLDVNRGKKVNPHGIILIWRAKRRKFDEEKGALTDLSDGATAVDATLRRHRRWPGQPRLAARERAWLVSEYGRRTARLNGVRLFGQAELLQKTHQKINITFSHRY